jgi:hypothetical protein
MTEKHTGGIVSEESMKRANRIQRISRIKEMFNIIESYAENMQINELILLQSDLSKIIDGLDPNKKKERQSAFSELANKLFNAKPSEEIAKLFKGEIVIPEHSEENFIKNIETSLKFNKNEE